MPTQFCESCQRRYYLRPDGTRPHSCTVRKQGHIGPRATLEAVQCAWYGCHNSFPAQRIGIAAYRLEFFHNAPEVKHPLCESHRDFLMRTVGPNAKLNGIKVIRYAPDRPLGGRQNVKATLTRLLVFERAKEKCEACGKLLKFIEHGKTRDHWQIDHKICRRLHGPTTLENLQILCGQCHRAKTNKEIRLAMSDNKLATLFKNTS
jgi:5-methylcytosine-specific restriction endonuclease McrA